MKKISMALNLIEDYWFTNNKEEENQLMELIIGIAYITETIYYSYVYGLVLMDH